MKKKFVEHYIEEDYKQWGICFSTIFIDAPTGTGKTFFIVKKLVPHAIRSKRKILILAPRIGIVEKYLADLIKMAEEEGICPTILWYYVTVTTYQEIDALVRSRNEVTDYYYLVCDECHFWLTEAMFNTKNHLSYTLMKDRNIFPVRILMSATGDRIFSVVQNDLSLIDYDDHTKWSKVNICSFRRYTVPPINRNLQIIRLNPLTSIPELVKSNLDGGKWLIFVHSYKEGEKLKQEINGETNENQTGSSIAEFICSDNRNETAATFNSISYSEHYSKRVLISTSVIEMGITLRNDVEHMIIAANTPERFIQMLGRRRFDDSNKPLFIYLRTGKIEFFDNILKDHLKTLSLYNTVKGYSPEFLMSSVFDNRVDNEELRKFTYELHGKLHINPLSILELAYNIQLLQTRIANLVKDENYFVTEQLSWLGYDDDSMIAETETEIYSTALRQFIDTLDELIDSNWVGDKEKRKDVFTELGKIVNRFAPELIPNHGFTANQFEAVCQQFDLPYQCNSEKLPGQNTIYKFIKTVAEE